MIRVVAEYETYSEMCEYNGNTDILSYPSKIIKAIDEFVELMTDGDLDFTNDSSKNVYYPDNLVRYISEYDIFNISDIGIDYNIDDVGEIDEDKLKELFSENESYYYLGVFRDTVYYIRYD